MLTPFLQVLEDTKNVVLGHFRSVLDSVSFLFSGHSFLCVQGNAGIVISVQLLNYESTRKICHSMTKMAFGAQFVHVSNCPCHIVSHPVTCMSSLYGTL